MFQMGSSILQRSHCCLAKNHWQWLHKHRDSKSALHFLILSNAGFLTSNPQSLSTCRTLYYNNSLPNILFESTHLRPIFHLLESPQINQDVGPLRPHLSGSSVSLDSPIRFEHHRSWSFERGIPVARQGVSS
jgi:hypothetical protein